MDLVDKANHQMPTATRTLEFGVKSVSFALECSVPAIDFSGRIDSVRCTEKGPSRLLIIYR